MLGMRKAVKADMAWFMEKMLHRWGGSESGRLQTNLAAAEASLERAGREVNDANQALFLMWAGRPAKAQRREPSG